MNKHYAGYKTPNSFIIVNAYRDLMALCSPNTFAIRADNNPAAKQNYALWMFGAECAGVIRTAGKHE